MSFYFDILGFVLILRLTQHSAIFLNINHTGENKMHNDFGKIHRHLFLNADRRERQERRFTIVMFSLVAIYFGGHLVSFLMG